MDWGGFAPNWLALGTTWSSSIRHSPGGYVAAGTPPRTTNHNRQNPFPYRSWVGKFISENCSCFPESTENDGKLSGLLPSLISDSFWHIFPLFSLTSLLCPFLSNFLIYIFQSLPKTCVSYVVVCWNVVS